MELFFIQALVWIAPEAKSLAAENKQQQHSFEPDMDEFRELRNFKEGDSLQAVHGNKWHKDKVYLLRSLNNIRINTV